MLTKSLSVVACSSGSLIGFITKQGVTGYGSGDSTRK
jgi:hypothetical protein